MATFNKTLHEILSTRCWLMELTALQHYANVVKQNAMQRIAFDDLDIPAVADNFTVSLTSKGRQLQLMQHGNILTSLSDARDEEGESMLSADEEVVKTVLVLHVEGPVTREGGACTYGSRDHRDLMMQAADDETCVGVLFTINTPGGAAMALDDYHQGFQSLRAAGKRTAAWVDGSCLSCGYGIACQCDRIFVMNDYHQLGCIGAMALAQVPVPGEIGQFDAARNIVVIASTSPNKNRSVIEAAQGDDTLLKEEITKCGQHFLDIVNECRPQAKPEHCLGDDFDAKDVIGSLCDEIADYDTAFAYVLGEEQPAQQDGDASKPRDPDAPQPTPAPVPDGSPSVSSTTPKTSNMEIKNICAALGITESDLHVEENGFFLNSAHVDMLDAALATASQNAATIKETEEQLATAKADLDKANADLTAAKADVEKVNEQLATTQGELETANATISEKAESITKLEGELATANETIKANEETIHTQQATIASQEAELDEMARTSTPAAKPEPQAQAATQNGKKQALPDSRDILARKHASIYA